MEESGDTGHRITRRDFVGYTAALAAVPLVPGVPGLPAVPAPRPTLGQQAGRPDSKFGGVQIGTITYSFRALPSSAEEILGYLVRSGIGSIELMSDPAEQFAGAPAYEGPGWPGPGQPFTDQQRRELQAAREAHAAAVSDWRRSASLQPFEALRRRYEEAGVNIHIVKFNNIGPAMAEDEVHYCFNVARALGAGAITTEISEEKAAYLAPFAAEHETFIAFHNHTQVDSASWEGPLSHGEYLGINLDIGHYVAGTNESPIPVIERYGDAGRLLSLHVKDRKVNDGANLPFGQGDTPIALVLQLMKRKGYTFPADIELEYEVPEGSDPVAEVAKCLDFCRTALADAPESDGPM
jgi:sugar phosphate isomerase/epimerase